MATWTLMSRQRGQTDESFFSSGGGRTQIQYGADRGLCGNGIATGCRWSICSDRLFSLATDERDWNSPRTRRRTSTHPAFNDGAGDEIDADRNSDRDRWSHHRHTPDEEPFVCSSAQRCNDLWHFLSHFDRRRIVGLLYPGATSHESRSANRAEIRMTCNRPGRENENESGITPKGNFDAGNR
jgi:hypothetical protein